MLSCSLKINIRFLHVNCYFKTLRKMLLYRSIHRGSKETDIILGNFARNFLYQLSHEELLEYKKILDLDDNIIYYCLTKSKILPGNIGNKILKKIINSTYI